MKWVYGMGMLSSALGVCLGLVMREWLTAGWAFTSLLYASAGLVNESAK